MNDATASARCDALIAAKNLLEHPFYQAWSKGTLPTAALKDYAREYGAYIATVGPAWQSAGYNDIAAIEDGHTRLWEETFAASLGTEIGAPQVAEVLALVDSSRELSASRAGALGALYAFEAQQPYTAQSKLKGLDEHYSALPMNAATYFQVHADDYDEPALLAEAINALSPAEQAEAIAACERMSSALWDALTGLHAPYAAESGCAMG
jgi:pyrroloquinoline-quinone synthase